MKNFSIKSKNLILAAALFSFFLILVEGAIAADPGHGADVVGSGAFENGSYSFPSNLTISGNFSVGVGSVRFFVNNFTGRVGIGTASPIDILHIADGALVIQGNNSVGIAVNASNVFYVNASSGRVGIGTPGATQALDVRGAVNISGETYVQNGTAVSIWLYNQTTATATLHNATWSTTFNQSYANLNTTQAIQALLNGTGIYSVYNATYAGINNTGNIQGLINDTSVNFARVGIGVASPGTALAVAGNVTVNSSIVRAAGAAGLTIEGNGGNVVIII